MSKQERQPEMPIRVAIWCAVSTPEQAKIEKDSLPAQERDGRSWAESKGGEVVRVYTVPGHSRKYGDWEQAKGDIETYADLEQDCEARAFDVLWCRHRNRLGRTLALIARVDWMVREIGKAEVYGAGLPHEVGQQTDESAVLLTALGGWIAEAQNAERGRFYKMGMEGRIMRRGLHPNTPPTGYTPIRNGDGQVIGAEFDNQIGAVDLLTEWFLLGLSYAEMVRRINETGYLPPRRGTRWNHGTVMSIMANDTYGGVVRWGDFSQDDPSISKIPARWDADTFAAIKAERRRRARGPYNRLGSGPLTGVSFCRRCGRRMYRVKMRQYFYLRCGTHMKKNRTGIECHSNMMPERVALRKLTAKLTQLVKPEMIDEVLADERDDSEVIKLQAEIAAAQTTLEDFDGRQQRIAYAYGDGGMEYQVYKETSATYQKRKVQELARIEDLEERLAAVPDPEEWRKRLYDLGAEFQRLLKDADHAQIATELQQAGVTVWLEDGEVAEIRLGAYVV